MADGLSWHVTGLWHPSDSALSDLPYYGQIADPVDGLVEIPLNDSRTARVTVSQWEQDIIEAIQDHAYARMLKVYYRDQLVFWGPIKLIEYGLNPDQPDTVTLSAVDPSLRLINQVLVRGDLAGALNEANNDESTVTVDYRGLRLLRDAGLNTDQQNTEDQPDLGIIDGSTSSTSALTMGVRRLDQVWNQMTQLSQSLGPDFALPPIEDTVGAYAQLDTFDHQGDDISATVVFHYGTGKQNVDSISYTDGSEYITHIHVLDRDLTYRFTEANTDAAGDTGAYVRADATDYSAKGISEADAETVLRAYGLDILQAYSRPLMTCTMTLPIEDDSDENSYVYGTDYAVGDTVGIAARSGYVNLAEAPYRITAVRLKQANPENEVQPEIDVIPDRVAQAGDALGGVVGS